jgi:nucleoside-diphosphate-sugar epimerase
LLNHLDEYDLAHILNHTESLWDELRGQNVFITGGTGFLGQWLLESLIAANQKYVLNAKVTVLTRNPDVFITRAPFIAKNRVVSLLKGEITTYKYPEGEFSIVIHAAAEPSARTHEGNEVSMRKTIVEGARRTLEFARTHNTRKFLFTSSGAIYGQQPSNVPFISEEYSETPNRLVIKDSYGQSKQIAETMCEEYSRKYAIEAKIARCFTFIGPYLSLESGYAISDFVRDAINGGPIRVNGDGSAQRSYLYAGDLAIWLWTILFKAKSRRPYNVGSDRAISTLDLANEVRQIINPDTDIMIAGKSDVRTSQRYVPSIERAGNELGLKICISLNQSITRYYNFAK